MNLRTATTAVIAAAALGAAGCGNDDSSGQSAATAEPAAPAATTPAPATTETQPAAKSADSKLKISSNLKTKPKIPKPSGTPPTKLITDDVVAGKGQAAKAGDNLTVQYVGVSYDTGEQFDASWDRGQPFDFPLGQGMVIPGWDQGLVGMKVGGRRTLVIPPDLGYGAQGSPPAIAPNATLVFVIDLLKIG